MASLLPRWDPFGNASNMPVLLRDTLSSQLSNQSSSSQTCRLSYVLSKSTRLHPQTLTCRIQHSHRPLTWQISLPPHMKILNLLRQIRDHHPPMVTLSTPFDHWSSTSHTPAYEHETKSIGSVAAADKPNYLPFLISLLKSPAKPMSIAGDLPFPCRSTNSVSWRRPMKELSRCSCWTSCYTEWPSQTSRQRDNLDYDAIAPDVASSSGEWK